MAFLNQTNRLTFVRLQNTALNAHSILAALILQSSLEMLNVEGVGWTHQELRRILLSLPRLDWLEFTRNNITSNVDSFPPNSTFQLGNLDLSENEMHNFTHLFQNVQFPSLVRLFLNKINGNLSMAGSETVFSFSKIQNLGLDACNLRNYTFLSELANLGMLSMKETSLDADTLSNILRPLKRLHSLILDNSPHLTGNLTLDSDIFILSTDSSGLNSITVNRSPFIYVLAASRCPFLRNVTIYADSMNSLEIKESYLVTVISNVKFFNVVNFQASFLSHSFLTLMQSCTVTQFSISNTYSILPEGFSFPKNIKIIGFVNAQNCTLTHLPTNMDFLSDVFELNLSDNALGGDVLLSLSVLTNLRLLDISNNPFTSQACLAQKTEMKSIQEMSFQNSCISRSLPRNLSLWWPNIIILKLKNISLEGMFPTSAPRSLRVLDLSFNNLSGWIYGGIAMDSKVQLCK
jgi:hypothetical protein